MRHAFHTTTVNTQEKVMHFDLFGSTVGTGSAIFSGVLGEVRETRWLLRVVYLEIGRVRPKNGGEGQITGFPNYYNFAQF